MISYNGSVDQRLIIRSADTKDRMGIVLKIGMIDVDLLNNGTRHPNLAQMKMSGYCKSLGHDVHLVYHEDELSNLSDFDFVLVSKVFNFTANPPQLEDMLKKTGRTYLQLNKVDLPVELSKYVDHRPDSTVVHIGGTGFFSDGGQDLAHVIEHFMPDYDLYLDYVNEKIAEGRTKSYYSDYLDCSIGFLTRGCFRKCSFCVNKKYDHVFLNTDNVYEFYKRGHKIIYLWDDNFLGYGRRCTGLLDKLIEVGVPFQFRQGLDIRLMDHDYADRFMKCKYHGDFIFAFDHIQDKEIITKKLDIWRQHCTKETKLYVLCGYDPHCVDDSKYYIHDGETIDDKDYIDICNTFERIYILMQHQCLPYIMRYHDYVQSKYRGMYVQIARWCNQPSIFKKMTFREFIIKNLDYVKGDKCASTEALRIFLEDHPDFPQVYLDMRWADYKS